MPGFRWSLFAVAALGVGSCTVSAVSDEGKSCRADDLCSAAFTCVLDPGSTLGHCRADPCSAVAVGQPCALGCGGTGQLQCTPNPGGTVRAEDLAACVGAAGVCDGGTSDAGALDAGADAGADAGVSLTVSPSPVTLAPLQQQTFTATGADAGVTWSILEGAAGGTIDQVGTYTAPCELGTFHVQARAAGASGLATVTVTADGGTLDPCFGNQGEVVHSAATGYDEAHGMALQSDGRILTCGKAKASGGTYFQMGVQRFNPNGTIDATFGGSGIVLINNPSADLFAWTCAVQPDGRILVAGSQSGTALAVARLWPDGGLDTSFQGGLVTVSVGTSSEAWAVGVEPDGKVVLAGDSLTGTTRQVVVERLNTDGTVDNAFGTSGHVLTGLGNPAEARTLTFDSTGRILVAGYGTQGAQSTTYVARLSTTGSVDWQSAQLLETASQAYGIGVDANGNVVVAGWGNDSGGNQNYTVARFTSVGALDTPFNGGTGFYHVDVGGMANEQAFGMAIQADGRIVAFGESLLASNHTAFTLLRLTGAGTPDPTFGQNGQVITVFDPTTDSHGISGAIEPDGKIVVAGNSLSAASGFYDTALARYFP